jgi:hypothetical protein
MPEGSVPIWQKLLVTIAVMLLASWLAGVAWQWLFRAAMPSYLSGAVGGIAALPTWELLRRVRLRR